MRGNELGCSVSTTTFLSVVVTVFSTLAVLLLGWLASVAWAWSSKRWKGWYTWWRDVLGRGRAKFWGWWQIPWRRKITWSKARLKMTDGSVNEDTRLFG